MARNVQDYGFFWRPLRTIDSFTFPQWYIVQKDNTDSETNNLRLEELRGNIISNQHDKMTNLTIQLDPLQTFHIPANSSFILDTFPSASSALAHYTLNTSRFDIIVLDPPWHNKAVSRLKTKSHLAYQTMQNILTEIPPLGNWLATGGIIAIWCTNNLKMIEKVKTVLFPRWGVELVAEWIWLKVVFLKRLAKLRLHRTVSLWWSYPRPFVNLTRYCWLRGNRPLSVRLKYPRGKLFLRYQDIIPKNHVWKVYVYDEKVLIQYSLTRFSRPDIEHVSCMRETL